MNNYLNNYLNEINLSKSTLKIQNFAQKFQAFNLFLGKIANFSDDGYDKDNKYSYYKSSKLIDAMNCITV